jgi:hypothetical protein
VNLRNYQNLAVAGVRTAFTEFDSTLLVMATGTGKTVVLSEVIRTGLLADRKAIVIAHREELIWQAAKKIEEVTGFTVGIEMAEYRANAAGIMFGPKPRVIVSSVQTHNAGNGGEGRMVNFDPNDFDLLIIDECFPAGTLVDGVPIEQIIVGDTITAFDELTGMLVPGKVTRTFKRPVPPKIVQIKTTNASILCTPEHPILTTKGWEKSAKIQSGDFIHDVPILRGQNPAKLHTMPSLLSEDHGRAESINRSRADEIAQSHERPESQGEDAANPHCTKSSTEGAGRERKAIAGGASEISCDAQMANRVCGDCWPGPGSGWPTHYKIDIANPKEMVAIEVDGHSHDCLSRKEQDARKDMFLTSKGWKVLRFSNQQIQENVEDCVQTVMSTISKSINITPTPQMV